MKAVEVRELTVEIVSTGTPIVSDISFSVDSGRVLGLVGESGSGKSTIAMALLAFARKGTRITGGRIFIDGADILKLTPRETYEARGRIVAYVPQDPSASLNPSIKIGEQLIERLRTGSLRLTRRDAITRVTGILEEVQIPGTENFLRRYPGQLSGGQQQRVAIAMAIANHPRLIVLDEPTTGIDVSTQNEVLEMVSRLSAAHRIASIYVSHDLAVIANIADEVLVLYSGRILEYGSRQEIFGNSANPYTVALLNAVPLVHERRRLRSIPGYAPSPDARPDGCVFAPRCFFADSDCSQEPALIQIGNNRHFVRCVHPQSGVRQVRDNNATATFRVRTDLKSALEVVHLSANYGEHQVLHDISLDIGTQECLALVGESGSGKSTLSRCIIGLHEQREGEIRLQGRVLSNSARHRDVHSRKCIQYVFQNPYGSLNPRRTIGASVLLALQHFFNIHGRRAKHRVAEALEKVELSPALANRYPNELSGGERQRAAIARALICEPLVLVCDEVTSGLDVSVQAAIIELLGSLMKENLAILFVTHNLAVVRSLADRVAVMNCGKLVELADVEAVFNQPNHSYTRHLLANILDVDMADQLLKNRQPSHDVSV